MSQSIYLFIGRLQTQHSTTVNSKQNAKAVIFD